MEQAKPKKSRGCTIALAVACLLPALALLWVLVAGPLANNLRMAARGREWRALRLPADTEVVQYVGFLGNFGGTGNHTEIVVGMVVSGPVDSDAILAQLPTRPSENYVWTDRQAVIALDLDSDYIWGGGIATRLGVDEGLYSQGYTLVFAVYKPLWPGDLRGH